MKGSNKFLAEKEWEYLTPTAKMLVEAIMRDYQVTDKDLALELVVSLLGEEQCYELETD